jgi:outer membrane protein OmpA-like peptidoglycan-associated protein
LNNKNEYLLVIQGDDFFRIEHNFKLESDTTINLKTNSIKYNKWKFTSLEFNNNSSEILPEMETDLDKVVDFLVDHPQIKLIISGHTDGSGDPEANLTLSDQRAEAIKKYIVDKGGIDSSRIEAIGYGNQKPIIQVEQTAADRKINRRVEFELIRTVAPPVEEKVYEEEEVGE